MWNTLRLYILLKNECSGVMRINDKDIEDFAYKLNITTRTIQTHLQKLLDRNWIGYKSKTKCYYIRGYNAIRKIEGLKNCRYVTKFELKNLKDLTTFKAFIIEASVGYIIHKKNKTFRFQPKRTGSYQDMFCSISSIVLGKELNVSQVMAWKYLRLAEIKGFLNAKRNNLTSLNKHVSLYEIERLKNKIYNNDCNTIRIKNNQLFYQHANQYRTSMIFKINKNLSIDSVNQDVNQRAINFYCYEK